MPDLHFIHPVTTQFPDITRSTVIGVSDTLERFVPPSPDASIGFCYNRDPTGDLLKVLTGEVTYTIRNGNLPLEIEPKDRPLSKPLLRLTEKLILEDNIWCLELNQRTLLEKPDNNGQVNYERLYQGVVELTRSAALISIISPALLKINSDKIQEQP